MFVSDSPRMRLVQFMIDKVAPTDIPVLIYGPSGAGKELIAKAIQQRSARRDEPYVIKNCATLSKELARSELFGHMRGAFTGAVENTAGLFTEANNGTLFLDEIGDLPLDVQPSLLRVLEDGSYRPVGCKVTCRCDVRIICATNHDLQQAVEEGRFNEALYHRIHAFTVELPPLAERSDDIPGLVEYFLKALPTAANKNINVDPAVYNCLKSYSWPGNIRQLRNVIERAVILAEDNLITAKNLPPDIVCSTDVCRTAFRKSVSDDEYARQICACAYEPHFPAVSMQATPKTESGDNDCDLLSVIIKKHILHVLDKCKGNRTLAAARLGIGRATLYRRLEEWGIAHENQPS